MSSEVQRSRDIWLRTWRVTPSRPDFSAPARLWRASGRNDKLIHSQDRMRRLRSDT